MQQFDPNLFNAANQPLMQGDLTTVVVVDPGGIVAGLGNHVLDPTQPFRVDVTWEISGALVPLWIAGLDPAGTNPWSIDVYAESIGGGPEVNLAHATKQTADFTPAGGLLGRRYQVEVAVAANTLSEGNPQSNTSGVYKLVAVVFLNSALGAVGYDLAGFNDGPIIQMESPI